MGIHFSTDDLAESLREMKQTINSLVKDNAHQKVVNENLENRLNQEMDDRKKDVAELRGEFDDFRNPLRFGQLAYRFTRCVESHTPTNSTNAVIWCLSWTMPPKMAELINGIFS